MFRATMLLLYAIAAGQGPSGNAALVPYRWSYSGKLHGTILVPPGYIAETYNYREGIVTRLKYRDSSCIILQHGGMYAAPLLHEAQYVEASNEDRNDRTVRKGSIRQKDRFWREDRFKPRVVHGEQAISFFDVFPPNTAYEQVPTRRVDVFNQSLDSFVWESKVIPPR